MTDEAHGDPNENLVEVFDTTQESEAQVVSGLLESAGIESTVIWRETPDVVPVGGTVVLVREEKAEAARQIIADSRAHPATDSDAAAAAAGDPGASNDPSAA
jgi:hypothetical protein